ncbi:zinc ribbon domain-containing protein [Armatimonas sp.]|uniref:zinc ribbon domain-containing protein n=1 Tax=Armatimonas sp. TaxID=1872638 RepID=UPI0037535590
MGTVILASLAKLVKLPKTGKSGSRESKCGSPAECAGRQLIKVNPAYTSQDCNQCKHRQKMSLCERVYNCPCCGLSCHRDLNASLNILKIAVGQYSVEA